MKKIVLCVATALLALFCVTFFGGCSSNDGEKLTAPQNVRIEDEILMWDEVAGASRYYVEINDNAYETEENSLDIFMLTAEPGTYTCYVTAISSVGNAYDSERSAAVEHECKTISNEHLIFWEINGEGAYAVTMKYSKSLRASITGKVVIPAFAPDGKPVLVLQSEIISGKFLPGAFEECVGLTAVIIPEGIRKLQGDDFNRCINLTRVALPSTVTEIRDCAFCETGLKSITLPENLEVLDGSCFNGSYDLKQIHIPASTKIGGDYLAHNGIERITVDEENPYYKEDGNCLIRKNDNVLVKACRTSVIPDYVEIIGSAAFAGVRGLTAIEIPFGITEIESGAFGQCVDLADVKIPGSVRKIGYNAFAYCTALIEITIPEGVGVLGGHSDNSIFRGCEDLARINLPASLGYLPGAAFEECENLVTVTVAEGNPYYKADGTCILTADGKTVVAGYGKSPVIPEYVEIIGECAFMGGVFTTITLPSTVKEIGYQSFSSNMQLESVIFPDNLISIGARAFYCCPLLRNVEFKSKNVTIGKDAFRLTQIYSSMLPS